MGIFDFLKSAAPQEWSPVTAEAAWVGTLYGFTLADGRQSDIEFEFWSRMLIMHQRFAGVDIVPIVQQLQGIAGALGWEEIWKRSALHIPEEERATVFAMACELALVDGSLQKTEMDALEELAQKMALDDVLASDIVRVMSLRYQGSRLFVE